MIVVGVGVGVGVGMAVKTKEQTERVVMENNWTHYEWLVERTVRVVLYIAGVGK